VQQSYRVLKKDNVLLDNKIKRAKFKGKLAGTAVDFGIVENRKAFFDFLVNNEFLEYGALITQDACRADFHTYMALKDFNYTSSWIQEHNELCHHKVGAHGSMLVTTEYRAIGYKSQVDIYG